MLKVPRKKGEFSKGIVILDFSLFVAYVITNIVMQWIKGYSMPADINAGVFGFLTGELGLLSFIKRTKITNNSNDDSSKNGTDE